MAKKSVSKSESGKVRRVIVVGGGLAGLMTTIKLCEAGVPVDLFSLVPVKRSHSVCAQGGINASVNTKGEGDSPAGPPRRDGLRRRLPRQPAAGQGHGRRRAGHRLHARPHGRAVQPHARGPARLPSLRRHALPPHGVRRRDHGPAAPLRARRAGPPLRDGRRAKTTRASRSPARRWSASSSSGTSSRSCSTTTARCVGIVAQDLKSMRIKAFPGDAVVPRDGRRRHRLRPLDEQRDLHRHRARAASTSRARCYAQRRVHPGAPDGDPRRRQAPPHLGERARRRRPRLGPEGREGEAPRPRRPREGARLLPRAHVPGLRQPRPARHREPRALQEVLPRGARRLQPKTQQERARGLPRPHAPADEARSSSKLAGILEIYEKFAGEDPYENPMKRLPGRPLLDGRPLGRLRARRATARS